LRIVLAKINVWKANRHMTYSKWHIVGSQKNSEAAKQSITIIKDNFFNIDLSDATVLIIYLVPKALGRLAPKFFKELKKGTRIVSYKYTFPKEVSSKKLHLVKEDKKNEIYFYKIT
jgi:hypothetical protein